MQDNQDSQDLDLVEAVRESIEIERNRSVHLYEDDEEDEIDFSTSITSLKFNDFETSEYHTVSTIVGNVKVIILGDATKEPIIAFTDIGTTYETCFKGFINYPGNRDNFLMRSCIFVVEMVGQSEGDQDLEVQELTIQDYVTVIEDVREEFGIRRFAGMGAGIGGVGLLNYALEHPNLVRGLILFSVPAHKCGWLEWFADNGTANQLMKGTMSDSVANKLISRYFTSELLEQDPSIRAFYAEKLKKLNPSNLGKLFKAYLTRPSISSRLPSLDFKSLIFLGKKSDSYSDYLDLNTLLKGSECIEVRAADLISIQAPEVTVEAIDNYLYSIGM